MGYNGFMFQMLDKLKEEILNLILPRTCVGCGREGQYICKDCEIFLGEVGLSKEVMSIWEYEGLMEKLIREINCHGKYHIIEELVEKALDKVELELPADTYITYMPMWKKKEKERGFNQSELIAKKLSLLLSRTKQQPFRVLPLLRKIKDNRPQAGLSPKERAENVKDVFSVVKKNFSLSNSLKKPEFVLLVDDVYITGATAKECVGVLRRAGVKKVWVFTLARGLNL